MEGDLQGTRKAEKAAGTGRSGRRRFVVEETNMDLEKDNGGKGLREREVALDLTRLKNWSNFEETAYRDFSQQRAERRSTAHRRLDESRRAATPEAVAASQVQDPTPVPPQQSAVMAAPDAVDANEQVTAVTPHAGAAARVFAEPAPAPPVVRAAETTKKPAATATAVAVYSLAGGVGKSTICAHLARSLYARGERVLLVDSTGHGMLSTYFGADEEREGLRQFCAPGEAHASVLLVSRENADVAWLNREIAPLMARVDRTVFDLGNINPALVDEVLTLSQVLLVPIVPGPQARLAVARVTARLDKLRAQGAIVPRVFYVLNRFNQESEQDREAMLALQAQCGEALAPIHLESNEEVAYAFAERMTISDFHTTAQLAQQYDKLAAWMRKLLPPSTPTTARRWSEV
jgi:cellulose biosynthesis protein BcsQ